MNEVHTMTIVIRIYDLIIHMLLNKQTNKQTDEDEGEEAVIEVF
jgi:hypothetical protein